MSRGHVRQNRRAGGREEGRAVYSTVKAIKNIFFPTDTHKRFNTSEQNVQEVRYFSAEYTWHSYTHIFSSANTTLTAQTPLPHETDLDHGPGPSNDSRTVPTPCPVKGGRVEGGGNSAGPSSPYMPRAHMSAKKYRVARKGVFGSLSNG